MNVKSGEKVEFDMLHFINSDGFVLYIGRFEKKKKDAEDAALTPSGAILKRRQCLKESVLLLKSED